MMVSDQCQTNCSFVAGEAASIFMLFFAIAFLARGRQRKMLLMAGIAAGLAAGMIRVAQGGHFLSDVVFAGVVMALVAEGLVWLIFGLGKSLLAENGPVHNWLVAAGTRTVRFLIRPRRNGPGAPSQAVTLIQ
jgi:membrane-associated phospholipid phosphatase